MKRVGDGPKAGPRVASPAGLQVQGLKTAPAVSTPWDQSPQKNSLRGSGKIPGGKEVQIQHGAGRVPASKKGSNVGLAYGNSSQSSMKGAVTKNPGSSGPAASTKGGSATKPRTTGVKVAPSVNYHRALGFGDKGMP